MEMETIGNPVLPNIPAPRKTRLTYSILDHNTSSTLGHRSGVNALAVDTNSHDGEGLLYSAGRDGNLIVWNLHSSRRVPLPTNNLTSSLLYSPSSESLSPTSSASPVPVPLPNSSQELSSTSPHLPPSSALFRIPSLPNPIPHTYSSHSFINSRHQISSSSSHSNNINYPTHHHAHPLKQSSIPSQNQKTKLPPSSLETNYSLHSHWINDMKLHPEKNHVITCSSDRSIILSTFNQSIHQYSKLGIHQDYVKCLAMPHHGNWVASAGLDGMIHIWDIREGKGRVLSWRNHNPNKLPLSEPLSVYSMACDSPGNLLCIGSLDRKLRLWDPRTPKYIASLSGHTDLIRSILISDDGKWILSASSDKTIKLWSISKPMQCVSTFNHFEDSVLCLYSNHPNLETFYAGCKDGLVAKFWRRKTTPYPHVSMNSGTFLDRNKEDNHLSSIFRGMSLSSVHSDTMKRRAVLEAEENVECLALFREQFPVSALTVIPDECIWAATTDSTINRWSDITMNKVKVRLPGSDHSNVSQDTIYVQPNAYLEQENQQNNYHQPSTEAIDQRHFSAYESTVRSLQSTSFQFQFTDYSLLDEDDNDASEEVEPVFNEPESSLIGSSQIIKFSLLNDKVHVISLDSKGFVDLWDILCCKKLKTITQFILPIKHSKDEAIKKTTKNTADLTQQPKNTTLSILNHKQTQEEFERIVEEHNTRTWHNAWCKISIHTGHLQVHLEDLQCLEAEMYCQERYQDWENEEARINIGVWVTTYLLEYFGHAFLQHKRKSQSVSALENNKREDKSASEQVVDVIGNEQNGSDGKSKTKFLIDPQQFPPLDIPTQTILAISIIENDSKSCGFQDLYRAPIEHYGDMNQVQHHIRHLMPTWVYSYVLYKEPVPPRCIHKIGFVMLPFPETPTLPVLAGGQNKLHAPHTLKMSKIILYVVDKANIQPDKDMIEMIVKLRNVGNSDQVHPQDWLELICHDQGIDPNLTLLTVKQSIWKSGGDVVLYYRRRHSFQLD